MPLHPWLEEHLVCPVTKSPLSLSDGKLRSPEGREYPVVRGVPIMLPDRDDYTHWVARASYERAREEDDESLYLDTLGITEEQRRIARDLSDGAPSIDPVVSVTVGATSGNTYGHLIGELDQYPLPDLPLSAACRENRLLDIGCGWGRWSFAAAQKGYHPIGLDPSLGLVLAAKRVSNELDLPGQFIVGDARNLPFADRVFDRTYSYSVFQHFSRGDVRRAIREIDRCLKQAGNSTIQMANMCGFKNFITRARRGFAPPENFQARHWRIAELKKAFSTIGKVSIQADCFFGLGLRASDINLMPPHFRLAIRTSEALVSATDSIPALRYLADSVFVIADRAADA